jgi:hypothetical protein
LITNADHLISSQMCFSTDAVVDVDRRYRWFRSMHPHTSSLSFCLSNTLPSFPFFPFHIKTLSPIILASIEIQISTYLFVLISKVASIRNLEETTPHLFVILCLFCQQQDYNL